MSLPWCVREHGGLTGLCSGFDLPSYVDKAFTKLTSDIQLTAGVNIGDYATTLTYTQPDVEVKTDESLNLLLPILAQPIVQKIVDGSVLGIETVLIKDIKENSFGTSLKGSIRNAGPCEFTSPVSEGGLGGLTDCVAVDAKIEFPSGLTIEWNGASIGSIDMPAIDFVGDVGASFEVDATFKVASVDHLTEFTKVMLTEESFDWVISGSNLSGEHWYLLARWKSVADIVVQSLRLVSRFLISHCRTRRSR